MALVRVVAWERCSKVGKWCPYSAEVSQLLENCYRNNLDNVCLGDADVALKIYTVNLKHMNQVSEVTGTKCAIRRQLYEDPVLERGFIWQWQGDGHDDWQPYEVDVNNIIECAFLQGKKIINLSREHHRYNYLIDFTKMLQVNKRTKRKRSIRRQKNVSSYPCISCTDSSNISAEANGIIASNDISEMQSILSDIDKEIPGTAALEAQVNEYMRNVSKNPPCENLGDVSAGLMQTYQNKKTKHSDDSDDPTVKTEDAKYDLDSNPSLNRGSKVALVNGKPWNDPWPPHTPESKLKPVPGIDPLPKVKKGRQSKKKRVVQETTSGELVNVIEQYTGKAEILPTDSEEQVCIICYEALSSGSSYDGSTVVLKLSLCSHIFHKACLEAMYNSGPKENFLQCPSCKKIHGEKCGIQPPGNMIYHVLPYSLAGYSECDTIRIIYDIPSGIQGPGHPKPGKRYTARGFPRHCYLPDNEKGRKVLRLLIKAWKRHLIFTIGRSSTTGEENTVTWNEIHHKTEFGCNRRGHGYPDPNYLDNVLAELEAHGVIDDEVYEWHPV